MGNIQTLPVLGEAATLLEVTCKSVAAGACAATGNGKQAEELINGVKKCLVDYTEVNCIAANVHLAVAAACNDDKKVKEIREAQEGAWLGNVESFPVVGHAVGTVRYACGDKEGGDRCMIAASRSTVLVGAVVLTGGAGALACGAASLGAGAAYDGIATGSKSLAEQKFSPVGMIAAVDRAAKTGDADDWVNASAAPVIEFAAGAYAGRTAAKGNGARGPRNKLRRLKGAAREVVEWAAENEVDDYESD